MAGQDPKNNIPPAGVLPADTPPADAGNNANPAAGHVQDDTHPVVFPRPAPTFNTETITSGFHTSAGAARWEWSQRRKRCIRCHTVETSSHMSIGMDIGTYGPVPAVSYQASATRGNVQSVPARVPEGAVAYLVIGIISAVDRQPAEALIFLRDTDKKKLFWKIRLAMIRLRGVKYFFGLKSVAGFQLYKCLVPSGAHQRLELDSSARADLRLLKAAYKKLLSVPDEVNEKWAEWVFDCLDGRSMDVMNKHALSLEVVLGWSPSRISIAVLSPVFLSLIIGFWFNSRDWQDLSTIQAAWGIASYIVTAGGCEY